MDCLLQPLLGRRGSREGQKPLRGCVVLREGVEELLARFGGLEKKCGCRLFMRVSMTRPGLASTGLEGGDRGEQTGDW